MIEATLALVREKGPRGFTLNEASRRAGVSKSAPYKHFKDKDALIAEAATLGTRTMEAELLTAARQGAEAHEKLLSVAMTYIAFARKHPDFFAVMFQSGIDKSPYPELEAAVTSTFNVAVALAAEIETSPDSVRLLSLAVWTMAHGFAMLMAEDAFARARDLRVSEATARQLILTFLLNR